MKRTTILVVAACTVAACSSETPPPGGVFADAGSDAGAALLQKPCPSEKGPKMVRVPTARSSFCIDATEVTRAQYNLFVTAIAAQPNLSSSLRSESCSTSDAVPDSACLQEDKAACKTGCDNHPQVCVTWCSAYAYCQWAGKKLCGSIDGSRLSGLTPNLENSAWVHACAGGVYDRGSPRRYPYGDEYDDKACNGDACLTSGKPCADAPVASYPKCQGSGAFAGIFDMSGNVSEWVEEYDNGAEGRVSSRGGGVARPPADGPSYASCEQRGTADPELASLLVGIRCCAD
jgi:formylglycine-generating enzyme